MKIAVCFSGHIRSLPHTYENIRKNLLEPNSADVYIHTWDTLGWHYKFDGGLVDEETDLFYDEILDWLRPVKKIIIENFLSKKFNKHEIIKNTFKHGNTDMYTFDMANNIIGMFYGISASIKMALDSDIEYDCIVRCRPDIVFRDIINIEDFFDTKHLFIRPDDKHIDLDGVQGGVDDIFAIGSPENMKKYADVISHLDDFVAENPDFFPEKTLYNYLHSTDINMLRYDANYSIIRPR